MNWRHFNTAISVLDIAVTGHVTTVATNVVAHLLDTSDLISGFDL